MKNIITTIVAILISTSAFAQIEGKEWILDGIRDTVIASAKASKESEKLQYGASEVEFKEGLVIKATITDEDGDVICNVDNPIHHTDPDTKEVDYVYQPCENGDYVSVYKDERFVKEFHFQMYEAGDDKAYAEAWIDVKDCDCKDPKKQPVILEKDNPGTFKHYQPKI